MTQVLLDKKAADVVKEVVGGGSAGTSLYYINVYGLFGSYAGNALLQVDDDTLETYEDLYNYLYNKGIRANNTLFLSIVAVDNENSLFIGITSQLVSSPFGNEHNILLMKINGSPIKIIDDESFSITYLGQE